MQKVWIGLFCFGLFACTLETTGTKMSLDDEIQSGGQSTMETSGGQQSTGGLTGGEGGRVNSSVGGLFGSGGLSTTSSVLNATGGLTTSITGSTGGIIGSTGGTMTTGGTSQNTGGSFSAGGSAVIAQGGSISSVPSVDLAIDTPLATSVSRGTVSVPVLRIRFSGDLVRSPVTSAQFADIGTGHRADIIGVYLLDSVTGARLTSSLRITDSSKILNFTGLNISTPTTITFMADISNTATQNVTHVFEISNASYIGLSAGEVIAGAFPIRGNPIMIIR